VGDVFGLLFEQTRHHLCIWHLAQNVFKNVAYVFSAAAQGSRGKGKRNTSPWIAVNRGFWRMAKKTDWQTIRNFDEEFHAIRAIVESARVPGFNDTAIDKVLNWLGDPARPDANPASLYAKRMRWAARWTNYCFTRGSNSTQRGESIFNGANITPAPPPSPPII
jgi:hypothetical protein